MSRKRKAASQPLVSSVSTTIKRTTTPSLEVATPEETAERKRNVLGIVDSAIKQFSDNLANGTVQLNSSIDLERLTKLMLLVSGEADSISGKPNGEVEETTTTISGAALDNLLDPDDPEVQSIYNRLYDQFNAINDEQS